MLDGFVRVADLNERKRVHCTSCGRVTIHTLEAQCKGNWSDRQFASGGSRYSIFRCGACDEIAYETVLWDSENIDVDEDGETYAVETVKQYPPPVSAHFNFNLESTPRKLDRILEEMLYSLAGSNMILATIGLRLAVEFIVKDKDCKGSKLDQRINDLKKQGLIDEDQRDLLHRIRKRGNAGAHDAEGMKPAELVAGMAIIDGLLEKLYNGPARHQATVKKAKQMLGAPDDKAKKNS